MLKFLKYVFIMEMIWINTDLTDRVDWEPVSETVKQDTLYLYISRNIKTTDKIISIQ